ncbi:response regulator transcription factor [Chloroflexota bacterium]
MVVDDDIRIQRMLRRILELEGYQVIGAGNAEEALEVLDEKNPALILLDVMMPGMDGHSLCRSIRDFSPVPIIMVTARDSDEEKVTGLDNGADDYLTKPFSSGELAARVRAVLRRSNMAALETESTFKKDGLLVDYAAHQVHLNGLELDLTGTEYRILSYLTHNAGRIVTPDRLLQNVWGESYIGEEHLLQVNMSRLRKKTKDSVKNPKYIVTKRGIGYMISK